MSYKTFKDIEFTYDRDGQYSMLMFENRWGVSVTRTFACSLGAEQGLYELVTLDLNTNVVYNTPLKGPIGFLTEDEVTELMIEVQNLPKKDVI